MIRSVLVGHLGGCFRLCLNGNVKMTTTHWPNRARRRIALAVALACSASVLPAGALEPNQANGSVERGSTGQVVQGSQGQGKQALRRLPGVEDSPAAITVATALTAQPEFARVRRGRQRWCLSGLSYGLQASLLNGAHQERCISVRPSRMRWQRI